MIIREWAARWPQVPFAALVELEQMLGISGAVATPGVTDDPSGSESRQQSLIRLEAASKDIALFRNNVGALLDSRGVPVRYGLANDSKQMNERIKSGDLIGIERVLIQPWHVGHIIGRFISVECKKEDWVFTGGKHELAQQAWQNHVISYGGRAIFANKPGML